MKVKKTILWVVLGLFVSIQFVPAKLNQSQTVPKTDFMLVNVVPNDVRTILEESCYDCHSNHTRYPWYNKIQPVKWFLEKHISEGKAALNFNNWDDYSLRRKKSKLKAIVDQIKDNEMPLSLYTFMHGEARLSTLKRKDLINYLESLQSSL